MLIKLILRADQALHLSRVKMSRTSDVFHATV